MHSSVIICFLYLKYVSSNPQDEAEYVIHERFWNNSKKGAKEPKLLTFNNDASNIRIEAVFAIPILAIPIGSKSSTSTQNASITAPKIDVNLKSIVAMGGILILLSFVIPKLVELYLPQKLIPNVKQSSTFQNSLDAITEHMEKALHMYNVDIESCAQKAICWTMNNVQTKIKQGKANTAEKLIDLLSSTPYLRYFFEDGWLWDSIQNVAYFRNKENGTCQKFSKKCSITQNGLSNAAESLLAAIKEMTV